MQVTVDGLKIEYTDTGSGIPLLLLHGWGSSSAVYAGVIAALSDRCRCVAPDFPGCGGSETMKTPWTIDDYCTFVLHFMAAVGLDQPILCGHSHGGRVIMKLAGSGLLHPPKIVFLDAAGLIPVKTPRQKRRAKEFKTIKKMLTLPGIRRFSGGLLEKARRHYGSADYNAAPEVLRKTMVSLVNTDLRELLPNISCPTLLIWGENDTATPLSDAKIIESMVPDAGLCVLKGTGHFSFCERPYEAHAILQSFIR
ncbi:MAG: alpha/beta hydrolase [Clostridia bacterium]|nr:alpha/beta hydrolase [Clostridia bacterium]